MSDSNIETLARELMEKLAREAKAGGYNLNPDEEHTLFLCQGLAKNREQFGYMACPCRLPDGNREDDLDIICPCDYRDPDLNEFGACFCSLYVSDEIVRGEKEAESVPERRLPAEERESKPAPTPGDGPAVYRCKVCGYLCARDEPPLKCPICKADKDRFEPFSFG